MNYQELETKNIEDSVYLLKGDDLLTSKAIKKIAKTLGVQKINISEFNADNFDAIDLINVCNQFSFFDEKRIVCVNFLEKELTANEKKTISDYVKKPNKDCCLLLNDNNRYFDFVKDVKTIDCVASETWACDHIVSLFNENGKSITNQDAKILYSYTLGNFNRIELEIKKISDYLGQQKEVTAEIIDLLVFKDSELKVFDLTAALGEKNKTLAHKLLYDMLKAGEPPIKILGLISNHFRRLFFAKINKGSNLELSKALGCKEYAIVKAKQQAEGFSASKLKNIQNLVLEADYNIKSGEMTQENALYYLIFAIMVD